MNIALPAKSVKINKNDPIKEKQSDQSFVFY